jgi:hypothetical protein
MGERFPPPALCRAHSASMKDNKGESGAAAEATRRPSDPVSVDVSMDCLSDSKLGNRDFQSWTEIVLTALKVLQFSEFAMSTGDEEKSAISILFSRIQAPERASVPKRLYGPALALPKVRRS